MPGGCWEHPELMQSPAQVKVKRRADDQKFLAQVLAIGTDCDIALLTVEDEAFWEGVTPLELGPLPTLQVSCGLTISQRLFPAA